MTVLARRFRIGSRLTVLWWIALSVGGHPSRALAEADTLAKGDVALGLYQTVDPFNRYWYHYQACNSGVADTQGDVGTPASTIPCSRFNLNSYDGIDVPSIYGAPRPIDTTVVAGTGLRVEYGLADRFTVGGETELVYSSNGAPKMTLGDSRLHTRLRLNDGSQAFSIAGAVKLPGFYDPARIGAPGSRQTDVEARLLAGGLFARRRVFYDLGFGYRIRLGYPGPGQVVISPLTYTTTTDPEEQGVVDKTNTDRYFIGGPADEVFLDLSVGLYASRRVLLFVSANAVNSTKGFHLDDYFITKAHLAETDDLGRPAYELASSSVNPENILTGLEEDYVRLGLGALFKAFPNGTLYAHYSYVVLGQNTSAFYVPEGTRIPVGSVAVGVEFTFGTRKTAPGGPTATRDSAAGGVARASMIPNLPRIHGD